MVVERRLTELDSLRGIAALTVCLFHFGFFPYGGTGVDLFFMISGFVIYMSISNAKSIKDFWFARIIRLYPAYWLSIIIAIICFKAFGKEVIPHQWNFILGNITMLQPVFRTDELVSAYWTLYVEMNFYILITLLWHFKLLKNIEWVLFIIMAIVTAMVIPYQLLNNSYPLYTRLFIIIRGLFPLISHFQLFAAGIIFYRVYTNGINLFRVILLLFSFFLVYLTHTIGGRIFYWMTMNEHLVCCLVYYLIFIAIVAHKASVLNVRVLIILGNISFPLYLVHQPFFEFYSYIAPTFGVNVSKIISIVISLIIAYLITYYFDVPLRAWLKKKYALRIKQPIAL